MDNDAALFPCALTIEVAGKYPVQLVEAEPLAAEEYAIAKTSDTVAKLAIDVDSCVAFRVIPW